MRPSTLAEVRRQTIVDAALPAGVLAAIAIAAATVPVQAGFAGAVVFSVLTLTVMAVAVVGGRGAGAVAGVAAAFSFDFFHVAPLRVLHLHTLGSILGAFALTALLAGRASGPP